MSWKTRTNDLREKLRFLRTLLNLGSVDLADWLGLSKQSLSNLEHARTNLSPAQYIAIRTIIAGRLIQYDFGGVELRRLLAIGLVNRELGDPIQILPTSGSEEAKVLDAYTTFISELGLPLVIELLQRRAPEAARFIEESFLNYEVKNQLTRREALWNITMSWLREMPIGAAEKSSTNWRPKYNYQQVKLVQVDPTPEMLQDSKEPNQLTPYHIAPTEFRYVKVPDNSDFDRTDSQPSPLAETNKND